MLKESPERVTTNQLEQKTTPTTQQVTDQSATIEQLNTAATESTTQPCEPLRKVEGQWR